MRRYWWLIFAGPTVLALLLGASIPDRGTSNLFYILAIACIFAGLVFGPSLKPQDPILIQPGTISQEPTDVGPPARWVGVAFQVGGLLLAGPAVLGLLYGWGYVWALCPQALVVMFYRQSQGSYDSLGAADLPELTMALFYCPIMAWLLNRAKRNGTLLRTARWIGICHLGAVVLAVGAARYRNLAWSQILDN